MVSIRFYQIILAISIFSCAELGIQGQTNGAVGNLNKASTLPQAPVDRTESTGTGSNFKKPPNAKTPKTPQAVATNDPKTTPKQPLSRRHPGGMIGGGMDGGGGGELILMLKGGSKESGGGPERRSLGRIDSPNRRLGRRQPAGGDAPTSKGDAGNTTSATGADGSDGGDLRSKFKAKFGGGGEGKSDFKSKLLAKLKSFKLSGGLAGKDSSTDSITKPLTRRQPQVSGDPGKISLAKKPSEVIAPGDGTSDVGAKIMSRIKNMRNSASTTASTRLTRRQPQGSIMSKGETGTEGGSDLRSKLMAKLKGFKGSVGLTRRQPQGSMGESKSKGAATATDGVSGASDLKAKFLAKLKSFKSSLSKDTE